MKFGLFYQMQWPEHKTQEQVFAELTEEVQFAEKLGFHSVWIAEHHFTRYGIAPSPLQLATYLAAKTSTIRLGTSISVLPFHNPVLLAEEVAMLDVLSGGRVDFGVGRGLAGGAEYLSMNVASEESEGRFAEMLDVLPGLWTTPDFCHEGRYYRVKNVTVLPRPVQKPYPPVYVGVTRTESRIREAVDHGWQVVTGVTISYDDHLEIRRKYRLLAAQQGKDVEPSQSPFFYHTYVAETAQEAREGPRDGLMWMYRMMDFRRSSTHGRELSGGFLDWVRDHPEPSISLQHVSEKQAFFGTPSEVADRIRELRDVHNVQYYGCDFSFGGNDHGKIMRTMELFAAKVMPQLA